MAPISSTHFRAYENNTGDLQTHTGIIRLKMDEYLDTGLSWMWLRTHSISPNINLNQININELGPKPFLVSVYVQAYGSFLWHLFDWFLSQYSGNFPYYFLVTGMFENLYMCSETEIKPGSWFFQSQLYDNQGHLIKGASLETLQC